MSLLPARLGSEPDWEALLAPLAAARARMEEKRGELLAEAIARFSPELARLARGGKRLRGLVCLAAARFVSPEPAALGKAADLAALIEVMHLASLLHDDVLDEAATRRGAETLHRRFGVTAAVLAGDLLVTRAFLELLGAHSGATLRLLAGAAAEVAEGETRQTLAALAGVIPSRGEYLEQMALKTGAFFRAAAQGGALAAGLAEDDARLAALGEFGARLGLAFQIIDDVLDWTADSPEFGKELLADARRGRPALPVVLLFEGDRSRGHAAYETARNGRPEALRAALVEAGCLGRAREEAERHAAAARAALRGLSGDTGLLSALPDRILAREN